MKSRILPFVLILLGLLAVATPVYWYDKLKYDWNAKEGPPPLAGQADERESKLAKLGQAGDSFGPFNTVFASLAFVTALLAFWRQHKDAEKAEKLRREDDKQRTEDKKDEDARHSKAIAAQERIARIQGYTSLINLNVAGLGELHEIQKACVRVIWAVEAAAIARVREVLERQHDIVENELNVVLGGRASPGLTNLHHAAVAFKKKLAKYKVLLPDQNGVVRGSGNPEAVGIDFRTAIAELKQQLREENDRSQARQAATSAQVDRYREEIERELSLTANPPTRVSSPPEPKADPA